jgi:hypothetical protein
MKELTIQGKTLQYEIKHEVSEYSSSTWTEFYIGSETVIYRKYWLFGELITKTYPKLVFKIWRNIEDKTYTKSQVRKWIEYQLELLDREAQIARGEII